LKSSKYDGLTLEQQVHAAACEGDVAQIERLGEEGVDMNELRQPDALHPLDAVAWSMKVEAGEALLRHGSDPARSTKAIVGAAACGTWEFLDLMLQKGGPADQEMSDSTAIRWAAEMNQEECVEVLLKHGAWELEPEQDMVLARLKRKRMARALAAIAALDPDVADECVLPPYWTSCDLL